jgi:hypothetical protein
MGEAGTLGKMWKVTRAAPLAGTEVGQVSSQPMIRRRRVDEPRRGAVSDAGQVSMEWPPAFDVTKTRWHADRRAYGRAVIPPQKGSPVTKTTIRQKATIIIVETTTLESVAWLTGSTMLACPIADLLPVLAHGITVAPRAGRRSTTWVNAESSRLRSRSISATGT